MSTIDEARKKGCNLIIAHHPLLFNPLSSLNSSVYPDNVIRSAIKYGIGIYAFHTNLDIAKDGLNDYLCRLLELNDVEPLQEYPPVRIGKLPRNMELKEAVEWIKKKLSVSMVKYVKGNDRRISTVAVCSGSCSDMIYKLKEPFDLFLTGDLKHHTAVYAKNSGINIVDATHFHTEKFAVDILKNILLENGIKVVISETDDIPWLYA